MATECGPLLFSVCCSCSCPPVGASGRAPSPPPPAAEGEEDDPLGSFEEAGADGADPGRRVEHGRAAAEPRRRALPKSGAQGPRERRRLRDRRGLRAVLPRRDRPLERVSGDQGGGAGALCQEPHLVLRAAGRERRHLGRGQQGEHLGEVPDGRQAQRDLGAGLGGQDLEGRRRLLPGGTAEPLRGGDRLGDLRLLHRSGRRRGGVRAAATTPQARTTTSPSRASPATRAALGYFGSRTTSRTATG